MVLALASLPGLVVPVLGASAAAEAAVIRAASAPALAPAAAVAAIVVPAWDEVPWSLLITDKPGPSSWVWSRLWLR